MLLDPLRESLVRQIAQAEHPREKAIDVMCEIQNHYGHMSDEAMNEAAELLGMTPLELEELATFYNFIFREPVGRYVIQLCDSAMCLINEYQTIRDHLCARLQVGMGETSADGLFTLLPACCIGYCDRAPAMLINRKVYGYLTKQRIDEILDGLILEAKTP